MSSTPTDLPGLDSTPTPTPSSSSAPAGPDILDEVQPSSGSSFASLGDMVSKVGGNIEDQLNNNLPDNSNKEKADGKGQEKKDPLQELADSLKDFVKSTNNELYSSLFDGATSLFKFASGPGSQPVDLPGGDNDSPAPSSPSKQSTDPKNIFSSAEKKEGKEHDDNAHQKNNALKEGAKVLEQNPELILGA